MAGPAALVTFHHHRISPSSKGYLIRSPQGDTWEARTIQEARAQVLAEIGLTTLRTGED